MQIESVSAFDDQFWESGFSGKTEAALCNGFLVEFRQAKTPVENIAFLPTGLSRNTTRRTWRVSLAHEQGRFQRYFSDRQFQHSPMESFAAAMESFKNALETLSPAPSSRDGKLVRPGPDKRPDFDTKLPGLRVQVERRKPTEITVSVIVEQVVKGQARNWVHKTLVGSISSNDFHRDPEATGSRYSDILRKGALLRTQFDNTVRVFGYPPYPISLENRASDCGRELHYDAPALEQLICSAPLRKRGRRYTRYPNITLP